MRTYYKSTHPKSVDWLLDDLKFLGYDRPSFRYLDPEEVALQRSAAPGAKK